MRRVPAISAPVGVPAGYFALCAAIVLAGIIGGGPLVSIVAIPVGIIMGAGAAYVAFNVNGIAQELGNDMRKYMQRGSWWMRLHLKLEPDQVQRFRSVAAFHIFFGLLICAVGTIGIYANFFRH